MPGPPDELVGRTAELARLRAVITPAASGRAATALVTGEAGVGKSRLVDEAVQAAHEDGALVAIGRCVDIDDGEIAFAPISAVLRALAAQVGDDENGPRPRIHREVAEMRRDPRVEAIDLNSFPHDEVADLAASLQLALDRDGERRKVLTHSAAPASGWQRTVVQGPADRSAPRSGTTRATGTS